MTYNIYQEQNRIAQVVGLILEVEANLTEESLEWVREVRFPELEASLENTRQEVCYLLACHEAEAAQEARGWDFDPEYAIA